MSATDPDPVYLILKSRKTLWKAKAYYRLADTSVVRIGSSHREDMQNCVYESIRITAPDGFEWDIKIEYNKHGSETVTICGCTTTHHEAEQFKADNINLFLRSNGYDVHNVIQLADNNGDIAYTLGEWTQTDGNASRHDAHYYWDILRVELKQWDPSYGEPFGIKDPASQLERAAYMKRAEADVVPSVKWTKGELTQGEADELMAKYGDMGFVVHLTAEEKEKTKSEDN
ncbi:hypothetical protein CC86DRAFT_102328 [Ophiobolus disseminans]|uniref:Uncharacterized protein n=1 Tax=Ophiobolus disseminans TaxID=1469910 RepID=A0A6A6ZK12_9PLEO|nr:hypothetical protein CC86DRAFT_102328 [Ophiobolus disseminans]